MHGYRNTTNNTNTRTKKENEALIVYAEHAPELAEQVAHEVGDAQIVALEAVGDDPAERAQITSIFNQLLQATDPSETLRLKEAIEAEYGAPDKNFGVAFVEHLAGSKKTLALIDLASTDPGYAAVENEERVGEELYADLASGDVDLIKKGYRRLVDASAICDKERETAVIHQVRSLR